METEAIVEGGTIGETAEVVEVEVALSETRTGVATAMTEIVTTTEDEMIVAVMTSAEGMISVAGMISGVDAIAHPLAEVIAGAHLAVDTEEPHLATVANAAVAGIEVEVGPGPDLHRCVVVEAVTIDQGPPQ